MLMQVGRTKWLILQQLITLYYAIPLAYIYIRGEFYNEASNLQEAINEAYAGKKLNL
jgi:NADH:ubiquinone oxidoreductase subunit F (NADH-binding)